MELYTSEEEQVDAVRRFLKENGKAIAFGLVLGLGGLFGWKYWQSHQHNSKLGASVEYENVTAKLAEGKSDSLAQAESFVKTSDGSYSVFAALQLAKHAVESGDYAKAINELQTAQNKSDDANLKALVALRLARVQMQNKQWDGALKTLATVKNDGWAAQIEDIRGDILLSKGDVAGAREAYSKGIESNASQALQALMRIKLNNLSS